MLTVERLNKTYKNGDGIKNLTFNIERGQIVALLGPNGAGKTTTIRCIVGLYSPLSGHIYINGKKPGTLDIQKATAFIPDTPHLYPSLTISEHVQFKARAYNVPKDKIKDTVHKALREVDIYDLRDRQCGQLSKGQKQRVILASAIVQDADLFVLDEPTVGLDIPSKQWLSKWLREKAENNKSVLISTHSLEFALEVAGRICLIKNGKLIKDIMIPDEDKKWGEFREQIISCIGGNPKNDKSN